MKQQIVKLRHWWQRNLGHVYASANGSDWYRFRARFGYIALVWSLGTSFIVRLADDRKLIIADEDLAGYGKPYGGWQWDYEPHGRVICDGGAR